ncbi:MAG: hypothetical protein ACLT3Y_03415 [Ruminococcus callidus]
MRLRKRVTRRTAAVSIERMTNACNCPLGQPNSGKSTIFNMMTVRTTRETGLARR